nr:hypothetical protein [Desulfobulbaceae bacterium]
MADKNIYKVVIDSLSAHRAIETNRSWQQFGKENKLTGSADCVGINYLFICDQASKFRCGMLFELFDTKIV